MAGEEDALLKLEFAQAPCETGFGARGGFDDTPHGLDPLSGSFHGVPQGGGMRIVLACLDRVFLRDDAAASAAVRFR